MVSTIARVSLRVAFAVLVLVLAFYVGRPLYWKLSATLHDIRERHQSVSEGISQLVVEAQRSVGWFRGEPDAGAKTGVAAAAQRLVLG